MLQMGSSSFSLGRKGRSTMPVKKNRKKVALAFSIAIGVQVLTAVRTHLQLRDLEQTVQSRSTLQKHLGSLHWLEAELVNAETGQRGFLLTGKAAYLEPYHKARHTLTEFLRSPPETTTGKQAEVDMILSLAEQKLRELEATIQYVQEGRKADAMRLVATDQGRLVMDEIRNRIEALQNYVGSSVHDQEQHATTLRQRLRWQNLVGDLLAIGICAALVNELLKELRKRKRIEDELTEAHGAAVHAAEAKSEFLAVMSHEIRTPMHGVIGMTDLLFTTRLTPEQHQFATTIRTCTDSLLTIINDILDFSKIESGKLQLERTEFNLPNLLFEIRDLYSGQARNKKLNLKLTRNADLPVHVHGDPVRLRQILSNLLSNAIKFTAHGEVVLDVSRSSEGLRFSVTDTGIGIPEGALEHLFKPFTQADSSTTRKYGGTGLGLAIVKYLVQRMGGSIEVKSKPGEGSCFHFTLPLKEPEPAADGSPALGVLSNFS